MSTRYDRNGSKEKLSKSMQQGMQGKKITSCTVELHCTQDRDQSIREGNAGKLMNGRLSSNGYGTERCDGLPNKRRVCAECCRGDPTRRE